MYWYVFLLLSILSCHCNKIAESLYTYYLMMSHTTGYTYIHAWFGAIFSSVDSKRNNLFIAGLKKKLWWQTVGHVIWKERHFVWLKKENGCFEDKESK